MNHKIRPKNIHDKILSYFDYLKTPEKLQAGQKHLNLIKLGNFVQILLYNVNRVNQLRYVANAIFIVHY